MAHFNPHSDTPHLKRRWALRARPEHDVTPRAENASNKGHRKTTLVSNRLAELGAGDFKQELMLSLFGSGRNARDQIEAAITCDLPDSEEDDDGPDPTPLEILLRAARIRAGWTERERRSRLVHRTKRVELQFLRFAQLIGRGQTRGAGTGGVPFSFGQPLLFAAQRTPWRTSPSRPFV